MLATSEAIGPAKLFNTNANGFRDDLQQMKLRQILIKAVQNDRTSLELRKLIVRLLLRMGLVRASAEDLLRAA